MRLLSIMVTLRHGALSQGPCSRYFAFLYPSQALSPQPICNTCCVSPTHLLRQAGRMHLSISQALICPFFHTQTYSSTLRLTSFIFTLPLFLFSQPLSFPTNTHTDFEMEQDVLPKVRRRKMSGLPSLPMPFTLQTTTIAVRFSAVSVITLVSILAAARENRPKNRVDYACVVLLGRQSAFFELGGSGLVRKVTLSFTPNSIPLAEDCALHSGWWQTAN